jgi:hypothetical protein
MQRQAQISPYSVAHLDAVRGLVPSSFSTIFLMYVHMHVIKQMRLITSRRIDSCGEVIEKSRPSLEPKPGNEFRLHLSLPKTKSDSIDGEVRLRRR